MQQQRQWQQPSAVYPGQYPPQGPYNYQPPQPPPPEVKKGFQQEIVITLGTKSVIFMFGALVGSIITFLYMTYVLVH